MRTNKVVRKMDYFGILSVPQDFTMLDAAFAHLTAQLTLLISEFHARSQAMEELLARQ